MGADFPTKIVDRLKEAKNNLTCDLTADVADDDVVVNVLATTGCPTAGSFHIENEVIFYTGLTASSFTGCTRGQDGTTAVDHLKLTGGEVIFGPEAHHINSLNEEMVAIQTALGITGAFNFVADTGNETVAGVKTFSSSPIVPTPTTDMQASTKLYVDTLKTALKKNGMICFAPGFIINGSSATLVQTAGTAAKCYADHLSASKTHWFDFPKIPVPSDYDGGDITMKVAFRCAAASKKHSLGIRVASVATTEPHNPDLAAAYQLYNEEVSGDTIGDVIIKTVTVTQANHLMVAGEIWHCKFVVEDDAGCDADETLFDWILIEWNKA